MKKIVSLLLALILLLSGCSCRGQERSREVEQPLSPYPPFEFTAEEREAMEANAEVILEELSFIEDFTIEDAIYDAEILAFAGAGKIVEVEVEVRLDELGDVEIVLYTVRVVDADGEVYCMILSEYGHVVRIDKDEIGGEVLWEEWPE